MGVLEFDRTALILNRVMVLGLAVFFHGDGGLLVSPPRCRSGPSVDSDSIRGAVKRALRLAPYAVVPLVAGVMLYAQVDQGFEGAAAKKDRKDYWRKNLATWKDVPMPASPRVDLDLTLDPRERSFHVEGTYDIANQRDDAACGRFR